MERIGVIGLGRMGSVIAQRMAQQGHAVTGFTRSGRKIDGIAPAQDLAQLVAQSDTLILSLLDDTAVGETLDTLVSLDIDGKHIIETSTVVPNILTDRIGAIQARGASAVDAPISGGPDLVSAGACGVFIGGTPSDAARAQATLSSLTQRIFHVGPLGAGLVMKTINNTMLQVYVGGLAEMMPMAKRAGLPLDVVLGIICGGPAGVPMIKDRIPKILDQDPEVGFSISAAYKDADVFQRVVESFGLTAPTLANAAVHQRRAIEAGLGERDVAALLSDPYLRG